jgi:5-methylcytosine-specific restriction enzyme B
LPFISISHILIAIEMIPNLGGTIMLAFDELVKLIASGYPSERKNLADKAEAAIEGIFGERYHKSSSHAKRVAFMPGDENVPFAGLVHRDSPPSGVYGGMSLIWFPVESGRDEKPSSLLTFVCGTRGLDPDTRILGRPGHARHLHALQRLLTQQLGVAVWTKRDPTDLSQPLPEIIKEQYPQYSGVFTKYGSYIYALVEVPSEYDKAQAVIAAFLDFYAWERGWAPLAVVKSEITELRNNLRAHLFPQVDRQSVNALLRERRFVILQGPPGTGKTRLAQLVLENEFKKSGTTIQFHPAVTYETFIAGISPNVQQSTLSFSIKAGWLVEAVRQAQQQDHLLVIDEINRADLGRVLGEAIYLFEPREIKQGKARHVKLPFALDGQNDLRVPPGLYVLGTMNNADRSIAILDLAVRRRFAFVDIWPDLDIVKQQGYPLATQAFAQLQDIFAQYAPDDALVLVPGHAYFLADSEAELVNRLRYELIPLLSEYLQEGRLGSCESELRAYIDWLEGELLRNAP